MRCKIINISTDHHWINIGFGVLDAKGRQVGFSRHVAEFDAIPSLDGGGFRDTEPGHYYQLRGISTRNGREFGSADIRVEGLVRSQVEKEFGARVERARLAAVRKFSTK